MAPMFAMPPVTRALILLNVALYVLEQLVPEFMISLFALWPLGNPLFRPWQLLTYAFLHDPLHILHIFLNMFALYMFGRTLETLLGRPALPHLFPRLRARGRDHAAGHDAPGRALHGREPPAACSGCCSPLPGFSPRCELIVIPVPIPLPAWLVVTAYALLELIFGITGTQQSVAHFAHLGGMLGGALCILYWRARGRFSS